MSLPVSGGFSFLCETLMKNMKSREKPAESSNKNSAPSEPIKVIKSDKMKNMLESMNKHFQESASSSVDEPIKIIECGAGPGVPPPPPPPPPPPMAGGNIKSVVKKTDINPIPEPTVTTSSVPEPPKGGIPPPPPPPPPPVFDPSKIKKRPKKEVPKKPIPVPSTPATNPRNSMREQLMKAMKKIGK